jgi:twitching motility protein PilT
MSVLPQPVAAPSPTPSAALAAGQTVSLDAVLTAMLHSNEGVSDCLFVVGRAPQVEAFGRLRAVELPQLGGILQPVHTKAIAEKLMGENERLKTDFKAHGSCDTSYAVPNTARFRVNIFRQNGNHAIIMRKLSTDIPTLEGLKLPAICKEVIKEKTGLVFVTGRYGQWKNDHARGDAQ